MRNLPLLIPNETRGATKAMDAMNQRDVEKEIGFYAASLHELWQRNGIAEQFNLNQNQV